MVVCNPRPKVLSPDYFRRFRAPHWRKHGDGSHTAKRRQADSHAGLGITLGQEGSLCLSVQAAARWATDGQTLARRGNGQIDKNSFNGGPNFPDADIGCVPGKSGFFILAAIDEQGGIDSLGDLEEEYGEPGPDLETGNCWG
jgi:hypothetical protein